MHPGDSILVVTGMPLSAAARAELSETLGDGYVVLDIKEAPPTANIVLTPVVSGQLLGSLRGMFPHARILFTELYDDGHGISLEGPLARIVSRGPDGYFVADGVEALGPIVQSESRLQLTGSSRRTPPRIALTGHTPPAPAQGPVGVVWIGPDTTTPNPPGLPLDLQAIDQLVTHLVGTASPRDDPLWAALAAECAIRLVTTTSVLVDVTDVPPPAAAELQIRVSSEGVENLIWP